MATEAQRHHMHNLMGYLVSKRGLIHYAQRRPMYATAISEAHLRALLDHGHGFSMDCSESVTAICKWAGLRDPNGLHYDGMGYTGTLLGHLPHYTDPKRAQVGALCVFGQAPGHHVVMVYEPGSDPLCFSHGQESDPRFIRWSKEKEWQPHPATFLSIADL